MAKEINTKKIRNYNLIAGFFHLAQMVVVLILSSDFTLPIVARYAAGPPGSDFAEPVTLLDAPMESLLPYSLDSLPSSTS